MINIVFKISKSRRLEPVSNPIIGKWKKFHWLTITILNCVLILIIIL